MYDLVGGGFHRYSVDDRWLVPHFEKMLYDNALLAPAYLHAWVVTGEPLYRTVVEQTLDYVVRELRLPEGGLASAQDADTNGVEGLTFTWAENEGVPPELLEPFEHGRSIIRGELSASSARAAASRSVPGDPNRASTTRCSPRGTGWRWRRLPKQPAGSSAATGSKRPAKSGSSCSGRSPASDGRLSRSWRDGKVSGEGFLDDYANAAHGLIELHVATGDAPLARGGTTNCAARRRAVRRP